MKPKFRHLRSLALAGSAVLTISYAQAASTWNGATDGLWSTGTNWDAAPGNGDALTFDGVLFQTNSNDTGLTNIGLLTLTGNDWNINLGTLTLDSGIVAGGTNNTLAGTLTLGGAQTWSNSTGLLTVTGTVANGGNLLTVGGAGDTTISSDITGAGGLTKIDGGILTLSGANGYTGLTTVTLGTLKLGSTSALGTIANGTTVASGGALDLNGFTLSTAEALSIIGTGVGTTGALTNSGAAADYSGVVTLTGASSIGGSGNISLGSGLVGNHNLTKVGNGTLTLGASSARTGGSVLTAVDGGTLRLTHANALGTATVGVVSVNNTGTLQIGGGITWENAGVTLNNGGTVNNDGSNTLNSKITVATAVGANSVAISTTNSSDLLTLGNGANDISGGNGTDDTITLSGPGTIRISNANDYIGNWILAGGTTQLGAAAALGATAARTIQLNTGATLAGRLAASTTFTANPITISGVGTATVLADRSAPGAGGITYTFGALSIGAQTLNATNTSAITSSTAGITFASTNLTGNSTFDVALGSGGATSMTLNLGNLTASGSGRTITKDGNGNLTWGTITLAGAHNWNVNGGLLTSGAITNGGHLLTIGGSGNTTLGGAVGGTGGITKQGAGVLTLSGNNTFSGQLTVENGTLSIATINNASTNGVLGNSANAVILGGTGAQTGVLSYTGGNASSNKAFTMATGGTGNFAITTAATFLRLSGATDGTGALTKSGAGTLMLSGSNSYTGGTTVSAGRLIITTPSNLGSGGLDVGSNTFAYAPTTAGALNIGSWTQTGGSIGTAVGGTASQSAIISAGAATLSGTGSVNVYATTGVAPAVGTHNLITATSGLDAGTYTLGTVFNNTNFTVSNFTRTATAISVDVASATAINTAFWKGGLTGATQVFSASNGSTQSNWVTTSGGANQALTPGATTDLYFSNSTVTTAPTAATLGSDMSVKSLTQTYNAGNIALNSDGFALTLGSGGINKQAGSGTATFAAPLVLGSDQTWTNNSANALTVSGGVNNGGNTLTIAGTGPVTFGAGGISGVGGIIMNGSGELNFQPAGSNVTYSGTTTLNAGTALYNGIYGSGNITLNGGSLRFYFGSGTTRALGSGPGQIQIIGGNSGFDGNNGACTVNFGNAGAEIQWGSDFFKPTILRFNDRATASSDRVLFKNAIDLNGSTRTIAVNGAAVAQGAFMDGVIRTISGTAGLIKIGDGNLTLTADNTYNGATTINGGTFALSGANGKINSTNALNLGGGTLRLINTAQVDRVANGANITSNGGGISYENTATNLINYTETLGALSLAKGQTNIVLSTDHTAVTGSQKLTFGVSGSGNLTQAGASTITFSGLVTGPNSTKNMIFVTGAGSTANTGLVTGREILGPWATTGTTAALQTDYAKYSSDYVIASGITASAESNWTNSAYAYTNNTSSVALGASRSMNALLNTAATATITLSDGVAGYTMATNGILNGATTLLTIAPGTVPGSLTTPSGGNLYLTAGSGAITINAPVTNGGGTTNLVKSGSGTVILTSATNSFGGTLSVNAGTLQVGNGAGTTSRLNTGGTYAGNIFIARGATLRFWGDSSNTLTGIISGDGNLQMDRGTTTLGNANTYTGKTSITVAATNATGSTVNFSSFNSVFTDVALGTVHSASSSFGAPTTVADGIINYGGGVQVTTQLNYTGGNETTDRIINFSFNSSGARNIDVSGTAGSLLKFTSAFTSNGTTSGPITLSGTRNGEIVQGLAFGFTNLTKSGAGTWTLGGAVGNLGITTVSANGGTLALQKTTSLNGGIAANWTAAKVVVNSGGTLALNVGAADEFSNADLTTILTNLGGLGGVINNNGLRSGSRIGFDTTNAVGGTFTIADLIADSTSTGGGAIGLTKFGTGKLILTGNNTATGEVRINAGTLQLGDGGTTGTIQGTTSVVIATGAVLAINRSDLTFQGTNGQLGNLADISGGGSILILGGTGGTGIVGLNRPNTFTGGVTLNAGTLRINNNGVLNTNGALGNGGTLTINGGQLDTTADRVVLNVNPIAVGANFGFLGTNALTLPGTVDLGGATRTITTTANTLTLTGIMSNGGLTKDGAGTLALGGDNTYNGATTVTNGTLLINGSTSVSSAVAVNGGTLGGTGTIGGAVSVADGATLSPGASIQSLVTGALTMASNSTFVYEAMNNTAEGADLLGVSGALSLTGVNLDLTLANAALSGGGWIDGNKLTLISYILGGSEVTSGFTGYADDTSYVFGTNSWLFDYNDTTAGGNYGTDAVAAGQNRFVTMTVTVIPEPSSALLGALGALLLLRRRR